MYDTILTATDGSPAADEAVEEAIQTAALYSTNLHVIYVVDTASFPGDEQAKDVIEELESEAERTVAEITDRAEREHVPYVETTVQRGTPHERILAYADEVDAELLVLGARGRGGYEESYLGSVAERVARGTDRPILLI